MLRFGLSVPLLLLLGLGQAFAPAPPRDELLWQHRNLGKAFYENPTTHEEAVVEFRKALELAPDSQREHLNYGLALLRTGKVDQGIAELERVQREAPQIPHTWFNLGVAYKKNGQYQRALDQFHRMVQLVPDEPISHYNLGVLYKFLDKIDEALKEFEIAANLDPNFVAPRFQVFNTYREADRTEEAARAFERFQRVKKQHDASGADAEDPNWSFYAEVYDPLVARKETGASTPVAPRFEDRRLPGLADPQTAGFTVLDADGDGRPDLLLWSARGIRLYRSGTDPVDAGLSAIAGVVSVAAGDLNNDGFPDLCVLTKTGAALYVNRKGVFEKLPAALPAGPFRKAVWLDYDHDYDLDLFLLGDRSVLLRNQGTAGFADHTADFPFAPGQVIDAAAFRVLPDTKAMDLAVSYADHPGVLYRDRLAGRYEKTAFDVLPAGAAALVPYDLDQDGWLDLAYHAGLLLNRSGKFEPSPAGDRGVPFFADPANRGRSERIPGAWAGADFNRDGLTDLAAVEPDGSIHLRINHTATKNRWLEVALNGVKNLILAPGTEVELKAGSHYQKQVYAGVPLVFGLGDREQVDTLRITWANGLIQNVTNPPVSQFLQYKEAPRLSGSCPMIYTWNGKRFEFLTDVLGVAPLGARAEDGKYFPLDHDEYVQVPGEALVPVDGRYRVRVTEELSEVTYLDQVRLIAVDHPSAVEIFSNDKWKSPPFPEFRLYGVERRIYPIRSSGGDFRRDAKAVAEMHALELDFGAAAPENRAVLVLRGRVDWADGSTFYGAAQQRDGGLVPPYLQVKDTHGQWQTVIPDMGIPSGKTKIITVDLTGKFLSRSREVRIVTNLCVYWNEIFLGENSAAPELYMIDHRSESATLGFGSLPDWDPTPGFYTRYGDVNDLLRSIDDRLVVMGSGDALTLTFTEFPPPRPGWKRDFLLFFDGWAKDRDANTLYSQTVEPLPFHAMKNYGDPFPNAAYLRDYNTRPALHLVTRLRPQ